MRKGRKLVIIAALSITTALAVWAYQAFFLSGTSNTTPSLLRSSPQTANDTTDSYVLHIKDASSKAAISEVRVTISSNNGAQCIQEPCPTDDLTWSGVTAKDGTVQIPSRYLQEFTYIDIPGYVVDSYSVTDIQAADGTLFMTRK